MAVLFSQLPKVLQAIAVFFRSAVFSGLRFNHVPARLNLLAARFLAMIFHAAARNLSSGFRRFVSAWRNAFGFRCGHIPTIVTCTIPMLIFPISASALGDKNSNVLGCKRICPATVSVLDRIRENQRAGRKVPNLCSYL